MNQIALNTDFVTPATDVVTRDAAVEYEMKLVSQAVEQSLRDEVNVRHVLPSTSASSIVLLLSAFVPVALPCCSIYVGLCVCCSCCVIKSVK